jgi:hypothetical protein
MNSSSSSEDSLVEIDSVKAQQGVSLPSGQSCNIVYRGNRICFLYVKLFDDGGERVLENTRYKIRSLQRDLEISGTTDEKGVLRHENLPDDHFTVTCGEQTELVGVYYIEEMDELEGFPRIIRMRGYQRQ